MADSEEGVTVDEQIRSPMGVKTDDDEPKNFVKICVILPTLKVKKTISLKNKVANGTVDVKFENRSFQMDAILYLNNKKEQAEHFRYKINKLPHDILPSKSYFKLKKELVILYIRKKEEQSWTQILSSSGLETEYDNEAPSIDEVMPSIGTVAPSSGTVPDKGNGEVKEEPLPPITEDGTTEEEHN